MTDFHQSGLISLCILSIIYYCHLEYQYLISYSYLSLPPTLPPSSLPPSLRAPSLPQMSPPQILWYSYSSLLFSGPNSLSFTSQEDVSLLLRQTLAKSSQQREANCWHTFGGSIPFLSLSSNNSSLLTSAVLTISS